ncbi:hypothetical protein WOLCODRAFT_156601 [Wolfiporia cocos MD-104 SS10]|uniref:Uncharacterized protein n=1 Tax=Wolfiporia cocos (strain MD-104) TaxID=742152 RepID=A0A2H3J0X1_WOLCO|nr:hypothetical protein WOLCODRAFT_156601 [Wolfiporia cocos MD-104 SS10]
MYPPTPSRISLLAFVPALPASVPQPILAAAPRAEPPARKGSARHTPLVTFSWVGLLLDKEELEELEEMLWSLSPTLYVRELLLAPAPLRYGTLVVSTGGHWTVTLLSGLADASLPTSGIENLIAFFGTTRTSGEELVGAQRRSGEARRGEVYLSGYMNCHDEREPWTAWRSHRRNWRNLANIGEMNHVFEIEGCVLASLRFPDIHFLPIDRPALLRQDSHVTSDYLHIMTGAGVLEGWMHYIWQFVSRELPGRIR